MGGFMEKGGAGVIGSALGFVGNMIGLGAQKRAEKRQREYEQSMYQTQKQDRIDFWNMENQYNDPTMQMERLKKAGLNPNLVYGNGATAQGGSIQAPNAQVSNQAPNIQPYMSGMANSLGSMVSQIYDLKLKDAQVDQTKAGTELTIAQTKLSQEQKYLIHLESALKRTQNEYERRTLEDRIEFTRNSIEKQFTEIENIRSGTRKNQQDTIVQQAMQQQIAANTKSIIDHNIRENDKQKLTLEQMQENITKTIIDQWKTVTDMQISKTLMGYQVQNLKWDAVLKMVQANFQYKEWEFFKNNGFRLPPNIIETILQNIGSGLSSLPGTNGSPFNPTHSGKGDHKPPKPKSKTVYKY